MEEIGSFEIPYELVEKSPGFSADMGGSVFKLTYRKKEDWEEAQKSKDKKLAKVRLVSFARTDIDQALDFMEKNIEISRKSPDDIPTVYCTGIGCHQFKEDIADRMKVNVEILTEMDCFIKAFNYLSKNLPRDKFVDKLPQDAIDAANNLIKQMLPLFDRYREFSSLKMEDKSNTTEGNTMSNEGPTEEDNQKSLRESDQTFPCMIAMLGSGLGYFQVNEDDSFEFLEVSNRGGRSFLGLGTILTGVESFSELMTLAERGDNQKVDMFTKDFGISGITGENLYSSIDDGANSIVYCFGKGVGSTPEQFKREDLAKALLHAQVLDIAQSIYLLALAKKIKKIYLCGSFVSHPLVRSMMTEVFIIKLGMMKLLGQDNEDMQLGFLNGGSHLGSLGAFMHAGPRSQTTRL